MKRPVAVLGLALSGLPGGCGASQTGAPEPAPLSETPPPPPPPPIANPPAQSFLEITPDGRCFEGWTMGFSPIPPRLLGPDETPTGKEIPCPPVVPTPPPTP